MYKRRTSINITTLLPGVQRRIKEKKKRKKRLWWSKAMRYPSLSHSQAVHAWTTARYVLKDSHCILCSTCLQEKAIPGKKKKKKSESCPLAPCLITAYRWIVVPFPFYVRALFVLLFPDHSSTEEGKCVEFVHVGKFLLLEESVATVCVTEEKIFVWLVAWSNIIHPKRSVSPVIIRYNNEVNYYTPLLLVWLVLWSLVIYTCLIN